VPGISEYQEIYGEKEVRLIFSVIAPRFK